METIRLSLFLPLLLSSLLPFALSDRCYPKDQKVLLQIKKSLNNPPAFSSWTANSDCCNWTFVTCNTKTNRVSELQVFHSDITGQIPAAVGHLPHLEILIFSGISNLTGEIPPSIANLKKLRNLLFTEVDISGSIPEFLGELQNLQLIQFIRTKLSGKIPASLGNLTKLYALSLDRNQLIGEIPESFGRFNPPDPYAPFSLGLSRNRLSGNIPESLKNVNFRDVDLSHNKLKGDASMFFKASKPTLRIDLSWNMLAFDLSTVTFPEKLEEVDISRNKIRGKIPEQVTKLTELEKFDVSHNLLCGKIPQGRIIQSIGVFSHNRCLCGAPLNLKCKSNE